MTVTLNRRAFEHAKELINEGRIVLDERDAWSEHRPTAEEENEFIRLHGFAEYGKWYLGINDEKPEQTKGHYEFPYGISARSIAGACSRQKAAPANTSTTTSKTRSRTCMACWMPERVRRHRSVHAQPLLEKRRAGPDIGRGDTIAVSAVHDPKHQAEQHAQQKACHQRKIKRYIFALDHDVARQPAQPDLAQIGPKQAGHQKEKAEHDQKTRHRGQP